MTCRNVANRALAGTALLALIGLTTGAVPQTQPATEPADALPAVSPMVKIDLNRSVAVSLHREGAADLTPVEFTTPDGRGGWSIRMPGNRPIATPAYADGAIFVGGGYGSHEFYAFDAVTGKLRWKIDTTDDGPTAAVVEDGIVAFNTESCTIIVVEAKTGTLLWQEWLGDPLMSQPAISRSKLFIAYPGGHPQGPTANANAPHGHPQAAANGPALPQANAAAPPAVAGIGPAKADGHRLLCVDLKTGKHLWEQDITADVISAPVIDGERAYLTCFDGTSFCIQIADGSVVWKKENKGISAPLIADGQVVMTARSEQGKQINEGLQRLDAAGGGGKDKGLLAAGNAEYLRAGNSGNLGLSKAYQAAQDSSVGFATAPAAANLAAAQSNANVSTVAGGWAYQGSRAAYNKGNLLNAQANRFNCLRASDGKVAWQAEASGKDVNADQQLFAPPALGASKLYVCSMRGHIACLSQKDGSVAFLYATGEPMSFQPALAGGNLYAGTNDGLLICLKTGDTDADGWTAWGGNAQHNKRN